MSSDELALAVEDGDIVCSSGVKVGREFERSSKQLFRVRIAANARGDFGQHADCGDVGRPVTQAAAKYRFGGIDSALLKRKRGFDQ